MNGNDFSYTSIQPSLKFASRVTSRDCSKARCSNSPSCSPWREEKDTGGSSEPPERVQKFCSAYGWQARRMSHSGGKMPPVSNTLDSYYLQINYCETDVSRYWQGVSAEVSVCRKASRRIFKCTYLYACSSWQYLVTHHMDHGQILKIYRTKYGDDYYLIRSIVYSVIWWGQRFAMCREWWSNFGSKMK